MAARTPATKLMIVAVFALTTPALLGIETAARALLMPADWEPIRAEMRPILTPVAWVFFALTVAAVPAGFAVYRAFARRFVAKAQALGGDERRLQTARLEAMFVASSVPQIPPVLATVTLSAGAEPLPVILAAALSAVAVAAIGLYDRGQA